MVMDFFDTILAKKLGGSGGGGGLSVTVEELSVTANGTYTATTGKAYSPVNVSVPAWELLAQKEEAITVANAPNAVNVGSITVSNISTSTKLLYVYIRDKAGKREGYFYESLSIFVLPPAYGGTMGEYMYPIKMSFKYASGAVTSIYATTTTGGFYTGTTVPNGCIVAQLLTSSTNTITLHGKNPSTSGITVDGTYSIQVYAVDFPVALG